MKKNYCSYFMLLIALLLSGMTACTDETSPVENDPQDGKLGLSYQIDGAVQMQTYALAGEPHECRVDEVYTLFFRAATHPTAPNQYAGYTRTGVTASTATGSTRVTLPAGEDVNDEWQLIFLANFDSNAFLDGETNVDDLLTNKISTMNFATAKTKLMALFNKKTGLAAPLPMSASITKSAGVNIAAINFKRRVARVDVSNSATNFVLETAQLWNARTHGYMFDEGGSYATGMGGDELINYEDQVANAISGVIEAKLYAFPNLVTVPTIRDHATTCLIIGGKYNGSTTRTYYRVNVSPQAGQQFIKANGAYTINITKVNAAGETDPGDAYDQSQLKVDYNINDWDDSFLGTYIFDEHGNGLAVSQRSIIFSEIGNQSVQLEVFTIASSSHPMATSWTVEALTGTDAAEFSATKFSPNSEDRYINVTAKTNNEGTIDRQAEFNIKWGSINLPVHITQLNPTSKVGGIKLQPSNLWFKMEGNVEEICVNLQGNFTGITRNDIITHIFYQGDQGDGGWLTMEAGITPDNPAAGLYYYKVTAANNSLGTLRMADIKFVITQGIQIATAQASVTQSKTAPGGGTIRNQKLYMWEKNSAGTYIEKGLLSQVWPNFLGLPEGTGGNNHLHFSVVEPSTIKYVMHIQSSYAWRIVPIGPAAGELEFSQMSDPGDIDTPKEITITAKRSHSVGWNGGFYLEYEDGYKTEFYAHQTGVLGTTSSKTYYYGTIMINGKQWLDREIGATVPYDGGRGWYSASTHGITGVTPNPDARGIYHNRDANLVPADACPPGFRTLTKTEADRVAIEMLYATATQPEPETGAVGVYYLPISVDPAKSLILNMNGKISVGGYDGYGLGFVILYGPNYGTSNSVPDGGIVTAVPWSDTQGENHRATSVPTLRWISSAISNKTYINRSNYEDLSSTHSEDSWSYSKALSVRCVRQ